MKKNLLINTVLGSILVVIIYFMAFHNLGYLSIRDWDESRLACNAFEMIQTCNPIVTYFDGNPEMWNTKPPLMIWLQVISIKIFGYTEFAIRFPSALAVIGIVFLMLWFSLKFYNKLYPGFFTSIIFLTSFGFMGNHVARTGDYDALLAFNVFAYSLFFLIYLKDKSIKFLYLFFVFLTLAFLTKGIASLIITPVLVIFVFTEKVFLKLLKNKHFYFGFFIFVLFGIGYYILRELINPGFLEAVAKNELGGRFSETHEGHTGSFTFYLDLLFGWRYGDWMEFLVFTILLVIGSSFFKIKRSKLMFFYFTSIALFFLLIISISETKLYWYDAVLYPFFAIILGLTFYEITLYIEKRLSFRFFRYFMIILFIYIAHTPFKTILKTNNNKENPPFEPLAYGYHFREGYLPKKFTIAHEGYNASLKFYKDVYTKKKGYKIETKRPEEININEKVLICESSFFERIDSLFQYEIIKEYKSAYFIKIIEKK